MFCKSRYIFCFLSLFLLVIFLQGVKAEEKKYSITGSELQRINDLVSNLKSQNEALYAQLQKSQTDVGELNKQLDELNVQITHLKSMLAESNQEITDLKGQTDASEKENQALLDALRKAESSLTDLEESVKATKKQLNSLVLQRNISIIVAVVVLISRLF